MIQFDRGTAKLWPMVNQTQVIGMEGKRNHGKWNK
jgi:hypothetical protein